jgi:hypothetical protein
VPATILDYAGADPIAAGGGRSLKDAVENGVAVGRDRVVSHYVGNHPSNTGFYVRTQDWRYISAADGTESIYEILTDPFEQLDVAALHPELLPVFRADVASWQAGIAQAPDDLLAAGRLTDPLGAAVGGEVLQLVGRSAANLRVNLTVLTGPGGDFRFAAVPRGIYTIRSRRHVDFKLGKYGGAIPVILPFGGLDAYLPLQVEQRDPSAIAGSATVRGTLRDASGRALDNTVVTVSGHEKRTISVVVLTDAAGRYRAENLPPGSYRVTARTGRHLSHPRGRVDVAAGGAATLDLVALAL